MLKIQIKIGIGIVFDIKREFIHHKKARIIILKIKIKLTTYLRRIIKKK